MNANLNSLAEKKPSLTTEVVGAKETTTISAEAAVQPAVQPVVAGSASRLYQRPPLFNPWRDFIYSDVNNNNNSSSSSTVASNTLNTAISQGTQSTTRTNYNDYYFSSHSCGAADQNDRRRDSVSRTCHFRNLYYHIRTKTWHYYPHPTERLVLANGESNIEDMDTAMWHVRESSRTEYVVNLHSAPYRPEVHLEKDEGPPSAKLLSTNNGRTPVFVLYRGSMPNYGHFIWDDALSIFSQLDVMNLADDDIIMPIPFIDDPKKYEGGTFCMHNVPNTFESCVKFWKKLYPSLWNMDTDCSGDVMRTGNWLQGNAAIGKWDRHKREPCGDYRDNLTNTVDDSSSSAAEYVVVPHVTVGSGRLALFSCYGECTLGRGPQLYRFRNYLMRRMLGEATQSTIKGYITFSLAHGASRGKGEVSFFEEEIEAARKKYGEEAVKAVDFANMTLKEQGILIGNSAALFTNHGGGSASTVFLPKGSSAFVYWRGQRRDHEFYHTVSYFTTQWIGYDTRGNVERTMRLLDMELHKTSVLYPDMLSLKNTENG